jgi:hypothetical protein
VSGRFALVLLLPLGVACSTHAHRLEEFRARWTAADFDGAGKEIDRVLAKETRVDAAEIARTHGAAVPADKGDAALLLLEKGMVELAQGRPEKATALFRRARDGLDELFAPVA